MADSLYTQIRIHSKLSTVIPAMIKHILYTTSNYVDISVGAGNWV